MKKLRFRNYNNDDDDVRVNEKNNKLFKNITILKITKRNLY